MKIYLVPLFLFCNFVYGQTTYSIKAEIITVDPSVHAVKPGDETGVKTTFSDGLAFFIEDNKVLTAAHVIEDKAQYFIEIDNKWEEMRLIKIDKARDIALLETNFKVKKHLKLAQEEYAEVILKDKKIQGKVSKAKLYFDIHVGNSGAPIINQNGDVIGIVLSNEITKNKETGKILDSYAIYATVRDIKDFLN